MELGSDYLAESGGGSGSGSGSGLSSAEPSLNGLKFGKKIYFEDVGTAGAPFPGSIFSSYAYTAKSLLRSATFVQFFG